jgi:hypothetical protein
MRCSRCRSIEIALGSEIGADARVAFADGVRTRRIEAIGDLRRSHGLGLVEAKFLWQHVTRTRGRCHGCDATLPVAGEITTCPRCDALNVDW